MQPGVVCTKTTAEEGLRYLTLYRRGVITVGVYRRDVIPEGVSPPAGQIVTKKSIFDGVILSNGYQKKSSKC